MGRQVLLTWDELRKLEAPSAKVLTIGLLGNICIAAEWQRDNEYILTQYRAPSYSYARSLSSIAQIHNETVNIHSHLLGSLLFFGLPLTAYWTSSSRYNIASIEDVVVFSTFFFGVAICFFLSSTFHVIANHSPKVAALGNQLDYLGIVILMWGSTVPSIYYGFPCDSGLRKRYWIIVTTLATICAIVTIHPIFRHPSIRPYRSAMYTSLGFSALGFITHGLILYGWKTQNSRMSIEWMCLMALFNVIGSITYAFRVPEKLYPKTFDVFGSSHQILHLMVILAGLAHMAGLHRAFDHHHSGEIRCQQS